MRKILADAAPLLEHLAKRRRDAGRLLVEREVLVDERILPDWHTDEGAIGVRVVQVDLVLDRVAFEDGADGRQLAEWRD